MRAYALLLCAFLGTVCLVSLPAETARIPLDEVRAGMRGTGVTVFSGSLREEFDVDVLGVLYNVMGPKRDIVVARLSGGPLANTGVIQGMSGSPVYIDGRLLGAVSYSLGSFSKDAIAGITPIDEMIAEDSTPVSSARRLGRPLPAPPAASDLVRVIGQAFERDVRFAYHLSDVAARGIPGPEAARLGTLMRPISTPLVLNGFVPELHDLWSAAVSPAGFVTTVGGVMSAEAQRAVENSPLQPGDAVGAALVRGDITMAGTGTVTMVEGNRVYAFGHPLYNLGSVRLPMTRAEVTTLIPSLALSSKIASIGNVVGTIDQDRATGIYGNLGAGPTMIPVRIHLDEEGRDLSTTFNVEIVNDPVFTPILAHTTTLNTLLTWTRQLGPRTYALGGTIRLRDLPSVSFGDVYAGSAASSAAAGALTAPLTTLLRNEFEPVEIEGIEMQITSVDEPRTATLERVWIDTSRPRPGDRVPLKVLSRNYRGAELVETLMVDIPAHATNRLTIQVSDAPTVAQHDQREGRSPAAADSLAQLIRNLNAARRNSRLYVRLVRSDAGAVDQGEPLPALPGSVLAVLEGNRSSGGLGRLAEATLGEWEIATDHSVSGSRRLTIELAR